MNAESNQVIPLPEHRRSASKFLTDAPTLITSLFSDVEIILPGQKSDIPPGRWVKIDDSWISADKPIERISSPSYAELLDEVMPGDEFTLREFLEFDAHERDKETAMYTKITTSYHHFSEEDFRLARTEVGKLAREHGGVLKDRDLLHVKRFIKMDRKFAHPDIPSISIHMRTYTFE